LGVKTEILFYGVKGAYLEECLKADLKHFTSCDNSLIFIGK
jgi:hypothetical protein